MNIKTWQERAGVDTGIVGTYGYEGAMQAEIDELRAALLESKDVGLRLLTCRSLFSLARGEINAQRKVLEESRRELHACQAVIHLHGGFDPAYVTGAQSALKSIDQVLGVKP